MKISQMAPSRFIKTDDLPTPRIATIAGIGNENVGTESQPEMKYTLNFQEPDLKPLILNKINLQLAALACGSEESDDWTGKQVVLFADPTVSFGGNLVGGVRIRPHTQAAPASPSIAAQTPPAAPTPVDPTNPTNDETIPW